MAEGTDKEFRVTLHSAGGTARHEYFDSEAEAEEFAQNNVTGYDRVFMERSARWTLVKTFKNQ